MKCAFDHLELRYGTFSLMLETTTLKKATLKQLELVSNSDLWAACFTLGCYEMLLIKQSALDLRCRIGPDAMPILKPSSIGRETRDSGETALWEQLVRIEPTTSHTSQDQQQEMSGTHYTSRFKEILFLMIFIPSTT